MIVNCGVIEEDGRPRDHDYGMADGKTQGEKVLALAESNKPESARAID